MTSVASLPPVPTHWLFDRADLSQTPSVRQNDTNELQSHAPATITPEQERILRGKGIHLVFKMGEFLQLCVSTNRPPARNHHCCSILPPVLHAETTADQSHWWRLVTL